MSEEIFGNKLLLLLYEKHGNKVTVDNGLMILQSITYYTGLSEEKRE